MHYKWQQVYNISWFVPTAELRVIEALLTMPQPYKSSLNFVTKCHFFKKGTFSLDLFWDFVIQKLL